MQLQFLDTPSDNFLCDRYEVIGDISFNELCKVISELEREFPNHRFLITLDDLGQACYTSMHSKMFHDLDNVDGVSTTGLPAACFEDDGEHKGYFEHKEEFSIRKANIDRKLLQVSFDDVCSKGISLYCDSEKDFDEANNNPSSILDRDIYILKVPVTNSHETICAFPNGYFSGDFNPFETIVFARILYEKFNYELIGLGATYMAFRKGAGLSDQQVQEFVEVLSHVYRDEFDHTLRNACTRYIIDNDNLLLSYTE